MATATPIPMNVTGAVATLNLLGVLPVIALAAVVSIAGLLYRRFRR